MFENFIFTSSSYGGHVLLWRTRPPKVDTSSKGGQAPASSYNRKFQTRVFIYRGKGDLIINILRFLACWLTFSAGPK